jgi:putative hydrolase of HD superfamily
MKKNLKSIANFIFEAGILAKTPRSGFAFLGSGSQSVAEHTNRMVYIGIMLSELIKKKINKEKMIMMCLFHDFAEARVSDLNYVHQKYVRKDEERALKDAMENLPGGKNVCQSNMIIS